MKARYVQVDLLIEADFNLRKLVKSFGDVAYALAPIRPFDAVIELNEGNRPLITTLRRFCDLIESLPPAGRALWDKAKKRVFDIGFDSGGSYPAMKVAIPPKLLARITALGATIVITIYPVPSADCGS